MPSPITMRLLGTKVKPAKKADDVDRYFVEFARGDQKMVLEVDTFDPWHTRKFSQQAKLVSMFAPRQLHGCLAERCKNQAVELSLDRQIDPLANCRETIPPIECISYAPSKTWVPFDCAI